jgi:diguanylate cyclase (GGDEF)-like protein
MLLADGLLVFLAACVALDLAKRLEMRLSTDTLGWLVGSALALACGLWGAQVLGLSHLKLPYAVGYPAALTLLVWLAAVVFMAAGMALAGRPRRPLDTLTGSAVLAAGVVLTELGFVQALSPSPGIVWAWWGPGLAFPVAWAGSALALWLFTGGQRRVSSAAPSWRALSALVLAVSIVGPQSLVLASAGLARQTGMPLDGRIASGTIEALASVGSLLLLVMLLVVSYLDTRMKASLQSARAELQSQSLRDPLTELPNRQIFEGMLAQAFQRADATQAKLGLLLINLDGFKGINETLGHRIGDRLLREVASRLRALAQPHMVARQGADEFLVLIPNDADPRVAAELASSILVSLGKPCLLDGREASVTCSIGIALYPDDGGASALIAHADAAMRFAKSSGGAAYCFFESRMVDGFRDQAEVLRDLRRALALGELELFYQPKIHAPTGEITGAEALMRWQHPRRGMISPVEFIPLAERFGLISQLGNWLIDEVCRQIRAWRDTGLRMRVAINLSVHQLRQPDLVERIAKALHANEINPSLLTCEITETVAMEDTETTIRVFHQLAKLGVSISIDDFGTGHSSLSYLRKLPASELKIDRSFVLDLETSEDARKVASAVINLAKSLDLKVVAEGVETEGQNRILREFGCDQLQGYLFAKPMSARALALWAMDDVGPRTMNFRDSLFKATRPAEP